jgi:hypothetical protein
VSLIAYLDRGPGITSVLPIRQKWERLSYVRPFLIANPLRISCAQYLEPLTPYEDEDFTLAVIVPTGTDEEAVRDQCLAASAAIEDEMDLYILPRVRSESF